ncbi:MAG: SDR family oxidoreductase [Clostridia bacterium]|nr:SDR family oxidoreductase [Clostridia bacterium]
MFDLNSKKALVTGATQGIGLAIAKALGDAGAEVFVNGAHSPEKCRAAADLVRGGIPAHADLEKPDGPEELFEKTGPADILVLNASVQFRRPWHSITDEEWIKQTELNLHSSLRLMQLYYPAMKERGWGRILAVGSVQQIKPHPDMALYAATKAAQFNLVCNLAKQLAPYGITVNNLAPGVIATPRNEDALADPVYREKVLSGIPAGYAGKPEDCAAAALLLCSDGGRYITGSNIYVDGGMHL